MQLFGKAEIDRGGGKTLAKSKPGFGTHYPSI
jgi:hypothetical protein